METRMGMLQMAVMLDRPSIYILCVSPTLYKYYDYDFHVLALAFFYIYLLLYEPARPTLPITFYLKLSSSSYLHDVLTLGHVPQASFPSNML